MDEFPGEADAVLILGEPVAQTNRDSPQRTGLNSWQRDCHSEEGGYLNKIRIPSGSRRRLEHGGRCWWSTGQLVVSAMEWPKNSLEGTGKEGVQTAEQHILREPWRRFRERVVKTSGEMWPLDWTSRRSLLI